MSVLLIDANNRFHAEVNRISPSHPIREAYNLYSVLPSRHSFAAMVWDGKGSTTERKKLYSGYKEDRPDQGPDFYAMMDMLKEILTYTPMLQIEVPGYEADDVIGTLAGYFNEPVTIHSNDSDFYQLQNVILPFVKFKECEPYYVTTYKSMVGDTADNIPGIKGFGPKTWLKNRDKWESFSEALKTENYELWNKLTDEATFRQCVCFFKIVSLQAVPLDDIKAGMRVGVANDSAAQQLMERYMI